MKPRRDYEVTALPDGDEVRISRTFDGVKYNIIFKGGEPLSLDLNTGRNSGGIVSLKRRYERRSASNAFTRRSELWKALNR